MDFRSTYAKNQSERIEKLISRLRFSKTIKASIKQIHKYTQKCNETTNSLLFVSIVFDH